MSNELSPLQERLYLRLVLAGFDTDVKIADLYNAVYPDNMGMWLTNRYMQQKTRIVHCAYERKAERNVSRRAGTAARIA